MEQTRVEFDGESLITPALINLQLSEVDSGSSPDHLRSEISALQVLLDESLRQFEGSADPARIVIDTVTALHDVRRRNSYATWQELIQVVRDHRVSHFFLQDPFTLWSVKKPRGYSGDAGLLDFIYHHESVTPHINNTTNLGRAIYGYTSMAPSPVAVRERRDILGKLVDRICSAKAGDGEVLAIAAGHLREASTSEQLRAGGIKRWVALDQDPESVATVADENRGTCIEATEGSVRTVLARGEKLGSFDLIYAAGLYDYLVHKVAVKLTRKALQMLKPGGTFLFANFSDDFPDDGYMESFMHWALLLRTEEDMWAIIKEAGEGMTFDAKVYLGSNRAIVYGEITLTAE